MVTCLGQLSDSIEDRPSTRRCCRRSLHAYRQQGRSPRGRNCWRHHDAYDAVDRVCLLALASCHAVVRPAVASRQSLSAPWPCGAPPTATASIAAVTSGTCRSRGDLTHRGTWCWPHRRGGQCAQEVFVSLPSAAARSFTVSTVLPNSRLSPLLSATGASFSSAALRVRRARTRARRPG